MRGTFILAWCVMCGSAVVPTAPVGRKDQDLDPWFRGKAFEGGSRHSILALRQGSADSFVGDGGASRHGISRAVLQNGNDENACCCFWGKEPVELGERRHRVRMFMGHPARLRLRGGRSERAPLIPSSGNGDFFEAETRRAAEALSRRRCQSRDMDLLAKRLASTRRMKQAEVVPAQDETEETTSSLPGGAGGWVVEPVQEGGHRAGEDMNSKVQKALVLAPPSSSSSSSSESSCGRLQAGMEDCRRVAGSFDSIEVVRVARMEGDLGDMRKILQSGSSPPGVPAGFFRPERPCMELVVYRPTPLSTIEVIEDVDGPPSGEPCTAVEDEDVGLAEGGRGGRGDSVMLMEED